MADLYELVRLANGVCSLREIANGETFHPGAGPMREALELHVAGSRLIERRRSLGRRPVVWDVGLGAAANAIAALESVPEGIEVHSFDVTTAPAEFALREAEALDYPRPWTGALREVIDAGGWISSDGGQRWQAHLGDFGETLGDPVLPGPDAIFWDLYSPETSPEGWTLPLFQRLFRRLDPARPCLLTSYSRSSAVRVTLLLGGFFVGRLAGVGEKNEMTVAANRLDLLERPLGKDWLARMRRSTNGAPLRPGRDRCCAIGEDDWLLLAAHAQFG